MQNPLLHINKVTKLYLNYFLIFLQNLISYSNALLSLASSTFYCVIFLPSTVNKTFELSFKATLSLFLEHADNTNINLYIDYKPHYYTVLYKESLPTEADENILLYDVLELLQTICIGLIAAHTSYLLNHNITIYLLLTSSLIKCPQITLLHYNKCIGNFPIRFT